ncbi:PDZ domain-containing protein [Flavimobilis soli]|uniref:PDZ domain-containing protein n=1 Tax=Flavimobilis soli TaxID=442709 RepID=A0A2A9ECE0_9MICO|nr:PDZ domain-containing protein [Flavimobilis soli]PFG36211.1 PDZ domain-containing protein [Flavimobilis soli]
MHDDNRPGPEPLADPGASTAPALEPAPLLTRRAVVQSAAVVVAAVGLAIMLALPTSFVVRMPGPSFDTLGGEGDDRVIVIEDRKTYEPSGQLRLTTVSALGNPESRVPVLRLVRAWIDPDEGVYPLEAVYPRGVTVDQTTQVNQADMVTSQERASVAALRQLGIDVPSTLTVVETDPTMKASGILEAGDVVTSLDGIGLTDFDHLSSLMDTKTPGDEVTVGVLRDGEPLDLAVETSASPHGGDDRAYLGVSLEIDFDMPFPVTVHIDDVGGPSAGMMFALGIMDLLTPEDEAGGQVIAGTGTLETIAGDVGEIGGITYKMRGARDEGATWFLAPRGNCGEVVGNVPDGMTVASVETLEEAYDAVVAIGEGRGAEVPGCS